ncbi:MAG: hypothetical protein OHK0046_00720 [Anaerolineae bacterium]
MNILGIGGWELAVIFIIMLIVAGPKRMIHWSYILGRYLGQLRILWRQMVDVVQQEFDASGVDVKLPKDIPTRSSVNKMARDALRPVQEPLEQALREVDSDMRRVNNDLSLKAPNAPKTELNGTANGDKPNFGTWSSNKTET